MIEIPVGTQVVRLLPGDRIGARVQSGQEFEPQTLAWWAGACAAPGIVIDVGAYTGLYAIAGALLGRVAIAFEPHPQNVERLRDNIAQNPVSDQVVVYRAAASDSNGTAVFEYNAKVPFTSGGSLDPNPNKRVAYRKVDVRTMTIDSLKLKRVTAIKIDVERSEEAVLKGAHTTIRQCRPAIVCEVLDGNVERLLRRLPAYHVERKLDGANYLFEAGI